MYVHLTNHINDIDLKSILNEITPFLSDKRKSLGLPETQAGVEYDLTTKNVIPSYVQLIENLCFKHTSKKMKCKNYWISVSGPNTTVVSHNHYDELKCDFSAILYLIGDSDSGKLNLEDYSVILTINAGDVVLFPAACYHSVTMNNSTHDRICIAFDLQEIKS